jgi:hypothetical protein
MSDSPYRNEATQSEKREVLRDTYLSRAQADADLGAQGRFKKETATSVTAVPTYPKQPTNSPWSSDVLGPEEPFPVDINAMEPDGTPNEIQASLEPTLKPPEVHVLPTTVEDRVGEPVADVATSASSVAGSSTSMKRSW